MIAAEIRWPVLFRETACADSLAQYDSEEDLRLVLSEFHDILDEFEGWDAEGRRLRMTLKPEVARRVAQQRIYRVPNDFVDAAVGDVDLDGLTAALEGYCAAHSIDLRMAEGESPMGFWQRVAHLGR